MNTRSSESRGVVLVITLIMLSVVTLMAVLFLSMSRRERTAVAVTGDHITARMMADSALARAQSEVAHGIISRTNRFHYDLMVSTNYLNHLPDLGTDVFDASLTEYNPTNVSYHADRYHAPLGEEEQAINIGNLLHDPRPPVYVDWNDPQALGSDFRYYLDFNRNGRFEESGWRPEMRNRVQRARTSEGDSVFTRQVGDPQWIGVLENPGLPHSPTNRFVGRYAFLVVPEGKTLDLNHIHNRRNFDDEPFVFRRHQGLGPWELDLAGFLRDINANEWNTSSRAGKGAQTLLGHRLGNRIPERLDTVVAGDDLFGSIGMDSVDFFSDGPYLGGDSWPVLPDNDQATQPYWGTDLEAVFTDINTVFPSVVRVPPPVDPSPQNRLQDVREDLNRRVTEWSSHDRYTIHRLLGQMGLDSSAASDTSVPSLAILDGLVPASGEERVPRIGLNFEAVGVDDRNRIEYRHWEPRRFFLTAADRLLQANVVTNPPSIVPDAGTGSATLQGTNHFMVGDVYMTNHQAFIGTTLFSIGDVGIQIWPRVHPDRKQYSANLHQLLQQAANITDVVADRQDEDPVYFAAGGAQHFPLVLRPRFSRGLTNGTVRIIDYVLVTNDAPDQIARRPWRDLALATDRNALQPDDNVWGIPWVISARKGLPSFNEFGVLTTLEMTRKLEINKGAPGAPPANWRTNQMVTLSVSNLCGLEFWNPYAGDYPREVQIHTLVDRSLVITNRRPSTLVSNRVLIPTRITIPTRRVQRLSPGVDSMNWPGGGFKVPFYHNESSLFLPAGSGGGMVRAPSAVYNHAMGILIPVTGDLTDDVASFFPDQPGFPMESLGLAMTNRVRAFMLDIPTGRIIDFVNLDRLVQHIDLTEELIGDVEGLSGVGELGEYWSVNRPGSTLLDPLAPTEGVIKQIVTALGDLPVSSAVWNSYAGRGAGRDREEAIDLFRTFLGFPPRHLSPFALNDAYRRLRDPRKGFRRQVPFSPTVRKFIYHGLQANDPLVHYTEEDLADPVRMVSQGRFVMPGRAVSLGDLHGFGELDGNGRPSGRINPRYRPWPATTAESPELYNLAHKDPLVRSPDDWQFPTNHFPGVGWLGRVHRGTPWQTIYLKAYLGTTGEEIADADGRNRRLRMVTMHDIPSVIPAGTAGEFPFRTMALDDQGNDADPPFPGDHLLLQSARDHWYEWSGSYGTHPTNDWKIPGLFTIALNDNAARGLLSVNQSGLAAWSAVLSGVSVQTNESPRMVAIRDLGGPRPPRFGERIIEPAGTAGIPVNRFGNRTDPLVEMVEGERGINRTRLRFDGGRFRRLGDVLSVPVLTVESPFLDWDDEVIHRAGLDDAAVERIPQQILSLLREDEPRVTIYAYGQTLRPADASLRADPSPEYLFNICTNYQITAEYAIKRTVRFDGDPDNLRAVVEQEMVLPAD